jgi:hypothetical protein
VQRGIDELDEWIFTPHFRPAHSGGWIKSVSFHACIYEKQVVVAKACNCGFS